MESRKDGEIELKDLKIIQIVAHLQTRIAFRPSHSTNLVWE